MATNIFTLARTFSLARLLQMHSRFFLAGLLGLGLTACGPGSGDGLDVAGQPLTGNEDFNSNDPFTKVQQIFTINCIRCHAGASAPQGMSLASGVSYDQIVGVASNEQPELLRIDPGNPDNSYLVRKIQGGPDISGAQMPLGGPFLSNADIQTVRDWVASGAPRAAAIDPDAEVIASLEDFANYRNWQIVDYTVGVTNVALTEGIHSSGSDDFARRVYANPIALNSEGDTFDNGSILIKEVFSYAGEGNNFEFAEMGGLLAMVKRGNGFSPSGGDWEWFNLQPDLSMINARGIDVRNGTCLGCHTAADGLEETGNYIGSQDFVFAHSSEVEADNTTFAGYRDWNVIDTIDGAGAFADVIGEAHGAQADGIRRVVYKKQLNANPDTLAQGYPIGTALVKEVINADDEVIEVVAMLKRGGDFSPETGNWEWFVLQAGSGEFVLDDSGSALRGALLMNGACVGCHSAANPAGNSNADAGTDFVFRHDGDPFNNNDEFIAELSDFVNYESWDLLDYTIGAANPAISGGAHRGNTNDFTRRVYANPLAVNFNGVRYDRGSVFVKAVTTLASGQEEFADRNGLVAMAKRDGIFNQENNGWEYFDIAPDFSEFVQRGADVNMGGCNNCHVAERDNDFIFPLPTVFSATNEDFAGYSNWLLVDDRSDRNPALGAMAHNAATEGAVRRVYKKQPFAYPIDNVPGYPVGTIYVKEIFDAGANNLVGLVGMAKATETHEDASGAIVSGWEFFLLDPITGEIRTNTEGMPLRGMGLSGDGSMGNGCVGCHGAANDANEAGEDFIFEHPMDPFVNAATN